ncbi:MAG: hypothetical protein AAGJ32_07995 [Pseudomonadota bacterium]
MTQDFPRFAITLAIALSAAISAGSASAEIRPGTARALSDAIDEKRQEILRERNQSRFNETTDAASFCEAIIEGTRGAFRKDILEACAKVHSGEDGHQIVVTRGPSTVYAIGGGRVCSVVGEVGRSC